jgi:hypothetical protein
MKKRITAIVIVVFMTAGWGFASEELEIFTYLYDAAQSTSDQLGILESVMEMHVSGAGSLYARAMARLVRDYPAMRNNTDRENAAFMASLLAEALGNEKQAASAPDLWRAVETFANPLVKSDAMIALGRIRAMAYLPQVIQILSDLNSRVPQDRLGGERIAFGAIVSLEKYQDISGYLPVFFASRAWYSDRVKTQALNALPVILADPTDQMLLVVRGAGYPADTKLVALRNIEATTAASNQSRSAVALAALTAGWTMQSSNPTVRQSLAVLRKESIGMLRKYGSTEPAIYEQLANSFNRGIDLEEKLAAVNTLATLATPDAAAQLNNFLIALNAKQSSGTATNQDNELVRAVIPAIGVVAHTSSRPLLASVERSNWPQAVVTLARDAASKIK